MLEKIGLPAKPSVKGNSWVVDASHCQGCSSQFTFINRKHHCRRCGGLFCGSCTQQRMILRGQGDSPVRICDPCKKLEEAARFQMRHGHKSKSSRGGSKLTSKYEDEMLNQILGTDKQSSLSGNEATTSNILSDIENGTGKGSSSNFNEAIPPVDLESASTEEIGSYNPEELLQQSLEEKKKYRILKGEGKPEEALRAFKRGKELERQAKALEVALRKNNRKILSSNSLSGKKNEDPEGFLTKNKLSSHIDKEEKKDLASELRELGWSDADLHDADKKPVKTSLEGELSALLGEVHKKSNGGTGNIDKTQVIALKRRALLFKRDGKIAEAKEELKKAKVLEKQLEEQEFLAGAEDSDDELSSLIRSLDDDKQDDLSLLDKQDDVFDFNHLVGVSDDLGLDGNFEVTDQDLEDPDIAAALESLGWTEDSNDQLVPQAHSAPQDGKALLDEVLAMKKEAVRQKQSGNVEEAMALLRKAKLLEKDAESLHPQGNDMTPNPMTKEVLVTSQIAKTSKDIEPKLQPKSKLTIQRELLGLKRKALVLKREGRLDEAEEELRKGKVLESQLEEIENGSRVRPPTTSRISKPLHKQPVISETVGLGEEDEEVKVTEQDMQDPSMLEMLESLGWKDEDVQLGNVPSGQLYSSDSHPGDGMDPLVQPATEIVVNARKRSKAEIQRELLSLKRKALTLRRQGETEEADEILRKAKLLESQMEEIEVLKKGTPPNSVTNTPEALGNIYSLQESQSAQLFQKSSLENLPQQDMHDPVGFRVDDFGFVNEKTKPSESVKSSEHDRDPSNTRVPTETPKAEWRSKAEIQRELLALKRKALKLRRQGETEEAEEVLEMAKVLEAQIEEMTAPKKELLLESTKDKEPDTGFSVFKEKSGDEEVRIGISDSLAGSENVAHDFATASPWNNIINFPPSRPFISTPTVSRVFEDETPLLDLDPPAEIKVVEHAGHFPQSGQSANDLDLLSGDVWQSSQIPTGEVESKGSFSSNLLFLDNSYGQSQTSTASNKLTVSKDEFLSSNAEKSASSVGKAPRDEMDSTPTLNSQNNPSDLHEKVLARKRKAVVLKREGKLAEAREELRQAKLLEKSLQEDKPQPDAGSTAASVSTYSDTRLVQEERKTAQQAPTPLTGRDRFKLQQESLAHKRKALKLRREGRMAEAEAEFELAKELENQLEESSGHEKTNNETDRTDDLGVEDLLDPQLLSALKAIGIQDAETVTQAPARPESSKPNSSKADTLSQEKSQLEERIKAEKIKAVNLKKAGKQAEALDALRRAKMYEKKLNTLG